MAENNTVQLGFALPLHKNDSNDEDSNSSGCHPEDLGHRSPHWSNWDGGKIGGTPSWLNPRDLPSSPLRCTGPCSDGNKEGTLLRFVAQLYCPADDVTENDAAFHRSLYVFACPTCCSAQPNGSSASSTAHHLSGSIRILRSQLPKQNDFYPTTGKAKNKGNDEWTKHTSQYWAESTKNDKLNLCTVCGQRSRGKCPKQKKWFCGPDHQKECLRASKLQHEKEQNATTTGDDMISLNYLPSVCYESELVVEEEPAITDADGSNTAATAGSSKGTLFQSKDITDADADLEQSDLNALTGNTLLAEAATGVSDPTTLAFYARMAIGGKENDVRDQCLRYCRWPENDKGDDGSKATTQNTDQEGDEAEAGPLWLSSNNRPPTQSTVVSESPDAANKAFPPPCQYCGAPRAFEFQLLPQMLHYLMQNPESDSDEHGNEKDDKPRQILTESERAILLEAKSKIESGIDLPEGFKEQHEAALASAREALLGVPSSSKGGTSTTKNEDAARYTTKGGLDWGIIAVYTCTASCGDGGIVSVENGAYMEEAAWMQPPLD